MITTKWNIRLLKILILCIVCLSIISCRSKKNLGTEENQETLLSKSEALEIFFTKPDYQFISGKAKVSISSENGSEKGTMYVRSIRDSLIWIAVKKLSVEGGRALITKDTMTVLNRLEKTYQKFALSELQERYGVETDFAYLQDMFFGLTPDVDSTALWEEKEALLNYTFVTMASGIYHEFHVSKRSGLQVGGRFREKFSSDGEWTYSDHRIIQDSLILPYNREYIISNDLNDVFTMRLKFSDIEVENPKAIKFNIPERYTKIK